jgi:hypothetical protein
MANKQNTFFQNINKKRKKETSMVINEYYNTPENCRKYHSTEFKSILRNHQGYPPKK